MHPLVSKVWGHKIRVCWYYRINFWGKSGKLLGEAFEIHWLDQCYGFTLSSVLYPKIKTRHTECKEDTNLGTKAYHEPGIGNVTGAIVLRTERGSWFQSRSFSYAKGNPIGNMRPSNVYCWQKLRKLLREIYAENWFTRWSKKTVTLTTNFTFYR